MLCFSQYTSLHRFLDNQCSVFTCCCLGPSTNISIPVLQSIKSLNKKPNLSNPERGTWTREKEDGPSTASSSYACVLISSAIPHRKYDKLMFASSALAMHSRGEGGACANCKLASWSLYGLIFGPSEVEGHIHDFLWYRKYTQVGNLTSDLKSVFSISMFQYLLSITI